MTARRTAARDGQIITVAAMLKEHRGAVSVAGPALDGPRPDEVRVRLAAAGACQTDLGARAGSMPLPLPAVQGHEGAGESEAEGRDVTRAAAVDRAVLCAA